MCIHLKLDVGLEFKEGHWISMFWYTMSGGISIENIMLCKSPFSIYYNDVGEMRFAFETGFHYKELPGLKLDM